MLGENFHVVLFEHYYASFEISSGVIESTVLLAYDVAFLFMLSSFCAF